MHSKLLLIISLDVKLCISSASMISENGLDLQTSALWAQHASTAHRELDTILQWIEQNCQRHVWFTNDLTFLCRW